MKRKLVKLPPVYEKIEERVTACTQPEGLTVTLSGDVAMIGYSKVSEYYRGLSILAKWQEEGRIAGHCDEKAAASHLTYMVDCSRNAVCSVPYLKKLLIWMAFMGYDRLMLYTEDTYEIEGQPFFGFLRGRLARMRSGSWTPMRGSLGLN